MDFKSKKYSLLILGGTAIICSRTLFFFISDTEGPNLLIVGGLAIAIFLLSLAFYKVVSSQKKEFKKLLVLVCLQILSVIVFYFFMK